MLLASASQLLCFPLCFLHSTCNKHSLGSHSHLVETEPPQRHNCPAVVAIGVYLLVRL